MEIRLLGPLDVLDGGRRVAIGGARQRSLLALLALTPSAVVPVDRLIDALWGDREPADPANALQAAIAKLRRSLGPSVIETRGPGYALIVAEDDVDAHRFEQLARDGRAELDASRTAAAVARFDAALAEWRGDALSEFQDIPVAAAAATRFHELRRAVEEDRFEALLAEGRESELIADLDTAITASPFRERLRGQLMLALYRAGRQADALRAFADARRVLADELGLEPSVELRRLETAILNHDPSLRRPEPDRAGDTRRSGVDPPTNLRRPLTTFVGRQRDLAQVTELLARERLISLVGPGGGGKTRLAIEVALQNRARFPDGVWFVALDFTGAGAGGIDDAVAAALGLSMADVAGQPALTASSLDRLRGLLADRRALIVLDNCEHVVDEAARLCADLLASAPELTLIATSREALRVPGEVVWPVPPLDVDDAVSLFIDRSRAAGAVADDSDRGLQHLAELCQRVDRMPLAIELTAARSNAFTVAQLMDRLDDRFRLLTGGMRTALPRQQTLQAVTDWSYDLLFAEERTVFERLSVFVGSFRLEDAEAVCAGDEIAPRDVGPLLGRLVDKSLLVSDGSGRFHLLLTLAQYGRERLAERGGSEVVRNRHAAHYLHLVAPSFVDWQEPGGLSQSAWLARLTDEHDNVRSALEWSIACEDATTAQLLAGHLGWFWWHTGFTVEGQRWLERALGTSDSTPATVRARAVAWSAWLSLGAGDLATASARAREAIDLREQSGDAALLGFAWAVSAQLALMEGRNTDAARDFERGQQAHEAAGRPWNRAIAAALRSRSLWLGGDVARATVEINVAIERFRALGDVGNLVVSLDHLSRMLQLAGDSAGALAAAEEAHTVSEAHELRGWRSTMSARLGAFAMLRGDLPAAVERYEIAVHVARELGLPMAEVTARDGLGLVFRRLGRLDDARRCHLASRALAERFDLGSNAVQTLIQLGYTAEESGDLAEARRWHGYVLDDARASGNLRGLAAALEGLAGLAAAGGDHALAATLLGHADGVRAGAGAQAREVERLDIERVERSARNVLGDDRYDHEHAAGRTSDLDTVLNGVALVERR